LSRSRQQRENEAHTYSPEPIDRSDLIFALHGYEYLSA
jgi:hypothetical protein